MEMAKCGPMGGGFMWGRFVRDIHKEGDLFVDFSTKPSDDDDAMHKAYRHVSKYDLHGRIRRGYRPCCECGEIHDGAYAPMGGSDCGGGRADRSTLRCANMSWGDKH